MASVLVPRSSALARPIAKRNAARAADLTLSEIVAQSKQRSLRCLTMAAWVAQVAQVAQVAPRAVTQRASGESDHCLSRLRQEASGERGFMTER
jgi:hypothetical protein